MDRWACGRGDTVRMVRPQNRDVPS
uniref:Uncharacterized protein n=1 Tax=Arundo donax TaxID=35708 RepID=A0A0A8Z0B3_ARUDO